MKIIATLLALVIVSASYAGGKPFGRKYVGVYTGVQEAFTVQEGEADYTVAQDEIKIVLQFDQVTLEMGALNTTGTFQVIAKTKAYYSLKVTFASGVVEYWNVYRKGKKILRKGLIPEPDTFLIKN